MVVVWPLLSSARSIVPALRSGAHRVQVGLDARLEGRVALHGDGAAQRVARGVRRVQVHRGDGVARPLRLRPVPDVVRLGEERVAAGAAVDPVLALARGDHVVASAAVQRVVATAAHHLVIAGATADGVVALATVDVVAVRPTRNRVVAAQAVHDVAARATLDGSLPAPPWM